MRIDAHQHYWRLDRGDYGWLTPDAGILYRDYGPSDLAPHLRSRGIGATVAVQAAPTVAETEYLLTLCAGEPTLAGVVGWVDPEADDFEATLVRLKRSPYFLGIRPMLQDLEDDAYIVRPKVLESLRTLVRHDLALDLLVRPRQLPHAAAMLAAVPGLRAVVDHIAKPDIAAGITEPWRSDLAAVAAYPNVYCKLSGMVTEADHRAWRREHLEPYIREVCRLFGPQRVMFGSDWPVCLLAASYDEVAAALEASLPPEWTEADRAAVFGANAAAFYRIGNSKLPEVAS
ncbi:amidohydrolase [Gordoniibacillus kamchatkensis]|uniref:Amidohydrolase n=1 Tax=Gordoniibacillus kamchatkensis TaxID=1590651 RepID=A0ABR5AHH6_9BACL|nr:amidohydrolase family protein [Paenibacillus sp. VKM B-2647]KIL40474.1 amidohydrolase [Paenibacillus sp. VKM B-2647]